MDLLQQSSKNKNIFRFPSSKNKNSLTEKRIKSQLGFIFSDILKDENKSKRRKLNMVRRNILLGLEGKPLVKFKTKRIFEEFEIFLNRFEK